MAEESKGIALAILGIVAVIAIIGLVLMFSKMKAATGDVYGGGLKWGEGGWQREGLSTRFLGAPELQIPGSPYPIETVRGGGKLGGEARTTEPRKNAPGLSFYESQIGIRDCRMAVATGWLEAGHTAQIAKNSRILSEYTSCYGVNKAWPEGFISEQIPGFCCNEPTY